MKRKKNIFNKKSILYWNKLTYAQNKLPRCFYNLEKHQPEPLFETKYKIIIFSFLILICVSIINKASFLEQATVTNFAKGNACTASIGCLESSYKNPASLGYIQQRKISSMIGSYFNNRYTINDFSTALPIKNWVTVSIHIPKRSIKNIPYQHNQLQTTSFFQDSKTMYQFGIAKTFFKEVLSIGVSMGQLEKKIHTFYGSGNFIHLGSILKFNQFSLGAVIQNIGNLNLKWKHGSVEQYPETIFLGTVFKINQKTHFLLDAEKSDQELTFNTGVSYQYLPSIKIMAGINKFSSTNKSTRIGLELSFFQINTSYAHSYHPQLGVIHKLKLSYDLV